MEQQHEILPFFPLQVFLLPGEDIPLRIFEPRYKQLMDDMRQSGANFVIPFVIEDEMQEMGCEVRLKEVLAENPGGRMVVSVQAVSIVRIRSYHRQMDGKLYAGGQAERLPCSEPVESDELKDMVRDYVEAFDDSFLSCCLHQAFTRQDVMKALNLPSEDKYKFAAMPDGKQKEHYLALQVRYLRMLRRQEALLDNDFGQN